MSSSGWQTLHGAELPTPQNLQSSFKLSAPPNTDIWRRNDSDDVFNAPIIYRSIKSSQFKSFSATVFASWKTQYDQGGIIIVFPSNDSSQPSKWIKAGIEYFSNEPTLAVVGCDRYSDWSLSPMSGSHHQKATFKAVRVGDTLWIHAKQEGVGDLRPVREMKWVFLEERNSEADMWIGVYAAKPKADDNDADEEKRIEVSFSGLEVEEME